MAAKETYRMTGTPKKRVMGAEGTIRYSLRDGVREPGDGSASAKRAQGFHWGAASGCFRGGLGTRALVEHSGCRACPMENDSMCTRRLTSGLLLVLALISGGCSCHKHCGVVSSAPPCCGSGAMAVPGAPVVPAVPAPVPPPPASTFSSSAAPCPTCNGMH